MEQKIQSMNAAWNTSELNADSSDYLEMLYEAYLQDPTSVSGEWQQYFQQLQRSRPGVVDVSHEAIRQAFVALAKSPTVAASCVSGSAAHKLVAVMNLIFAYRSFGHRLAKLDPLGLQKITPQRNLTLEYHGLSPADLAQSFDVQTLNFKGAAKLSDIIAELERFYCGTVGVEYMHISSHDEKIWIRSQVEAKTKAALSPEEKRWLHGRLVAADGLEKYLGMRFVGQKRFSLEGGDSLIPCLDQLIRHGALQGVEEIMIGMAHRGRLNVLINVVGKSPENLFAEFEGKHHHDLLSGDVKYHNGFSAVVKTPHKPVYVAVAFNPSHLEIVAPVVGGSARARQDRIAERSKVLPLLIHGDAAFSGQGVVMENFNMSQTRGFKTEGSVHIVINNQVGFTTSNPEDMRSSPYCTDVAKMVEAPIFHVNGDDPEAVLWVTELALQYRQQFKKDVVIDLVCYRLHGHNESDEPFGTQPLMYQAIKGHQAPHLLYAQQLEQSGVLSKADAEQTIQRYRQLLEAGKPVVELIDKNTLKKAVSWSPYLGVPWNIACATQVDAKILTALAQKLEHIPEGFTLQQQVAKTIADRQKMTQGALPINWGYAELLAYATLVNEGFSIRLSGQDVGRGTFAHRHAVLHDYKNDAVYVPLQHLNAQQPRVEIIDSVLSEEAVMAFEYGYACSDPKALVIWEAQFGDFANNAQVVIDQFISSAEEKWGRLSGLTLFLPHGYEGMGAEHSSARLERFLQLCAHDNLQVCVPSTPAQQFHLIRRQMVRPYRKPLVVMTPKSLLRHPLVTSTLEDLAKGQFEVVLDEIDTLKSKTLKSVVFCQGKVYYDLLATRREAKVEDVALVRIEQLYPFPLEAVKAILKKYAGVKDIVWCQEEPENQGAWWQLHWSLDALLVKDQTLRYVGRKAFAAPAVGYPQLHKEQQTELVNQALGLK